MGAFTHTQQYNKKGSHTMAESEKDLIEQLKKAARDYEPRLKRGWGEYGNYYTGYGLEGHLEKLYDEWYDKSYSTGFKEDRLSELMNLISKIDDDYLRYVLYTGMMRRVFFNEIHTGGSMRGGLLDSVLNSTLFVSLCKHAATSKYSTFDDKYICMHFIHEPRIMDSALAMLRKEIPSVFAKGEFPDVKKLDYILSEAKSLKQIAGFGKQADKMTEIEALYQKDGYIEKIDKEFNRETILNSHIHSHNLPEYMIQDVIPGTEQDINYDESEKVSTETPKEPEPAQATIVELEQENKIGELEKNLSEKNRQLKKSDAQIEQLQDDISDLKTQKKEDNATINDLKQQNRTLNMRLGQERVQRLTAEQKLAKLEMEIAKTQADKLFASKDAKDAYKKAQENYQAITKELEQAR